MSLEPAKGSELAIKTAGALLGAAIGAVFLGPVGGYLGAELGGAVASGIGATITPILEDWFGRSAREFGRRGTEIAQGASDATGRDAEELVKMALANDDLQPLVARILESAGRTNDLTRLRAMGAVLGEAVVNRPRRIDVDVLIVSALNDLEPASVRVLEVLEPAASDGHASWTSQQVQEQLHGQLDSLGCGAALGSLTRHGLVETVPAFGGITRYGLTQFGTAMLGVLRTPLATSAEEY